jgi:hypothetical protein
MSTFSNSRTASSIFQANRHSPIWNAPAHRTPRVFPPRRYAAIASSGRGVLRPSCTNCGSNVCSPSVCCQCFASALAWSHHCAPAPPVEAASLAHLRIWAPNHPPNATAAAYWPTGCPRHTAPPAATPTPIAPAASTNSAQRRNPSPVRQAPVGTAARTSAVISAVVDLFVSGASASIASGCVRPAAAA